MLFLSVINWGVALKEWNGEVVSFQSFKQLSSLYVFDYKALRITFSFYFGKIEEKVTVLW